MPTVSRKNFPFDDLRIAEVSEINIRRTPVQIFRRLTQRISVQPDSDYIDIFEIDLIHADSVLRTIPEFVVIGQQKQRSKKIFIQLIDRAVKAFDDRTEFLRATFGCLWSFAAIEHFNTFF